MYFKLKENTGPSLQKKTRRSPPSSSLSRPTPTSPRPPTRHATALLLHAQIEAHGQLRRRLLSLLNEDRLLGRRSRAGITAAVPLLPPPRLLAASNVPANKPQRRRHFRVPRIQARPTRPGPRPRWRWFVAGELAVPAVATADVTPTSRWAHFVSDIFFSPQKIKKLLNP